MSYPVNYFQAIIQTVLADGRTFGIFLGDGIGAEMAEKSSSEDFLTLDGKVIKLDQTILQEPNTKDIMASNKRLKTNAVHVRDSYCELAYEPEWLQNSLVYALIIAVQQKGTWGRYTG